MCPKQPLHNLCSGLPQKRLRTAASTPAASAASNVLAVGPGPAPAAGASAGAPPAAPPRAPAQSPSAWGPPLRACAGPTLSAAPLPLYAVGGGTEPDADGRRGRGRPGGPSDGQRRAELCTLAASGAGAASGTGGVSCRACKRECME